MLAMHTSIICYYQVRQKKPDRRSLSRRWYQVLQTVWSISWSKGYSIPLLTPVISASFVFGPRKNYTARRKHNTKICFFLNRASNTRRGCDPPHTHIRKGKKERFLRQKLLKGFHKGENVTVLAILERLEFKNFSVFHGSSTLKPISPTLLKPRRKNKILSCCYLSFFMKKLFFWSS